MVHSILLVGRRAVASALLGSPVWAAQAQTKVVRYPRPGTGVADAHDYLATLLGMALDAGGMVARVQASAAPMVQARWLMELERPVDQALVDVAWTMTTPALEARFFPVRVPVFMGLFGWRVMLVRKAERERWMGARSLADLKSTVFGQGEGWADTAILRANGLRVRTASHSAALVAMLLNGQIDAFPRGVAELWGEMERLGDVVALEPSLVLRYRAPMYFFVNRDRPDLAQALTAGMERLLASGRLTQFVKEQLQSEFALAQLPKRRVLDLMNPLLTPETPPPNSRAWFSLNGQ